MRSSVAGGPPVRVALRHRHRRGKEPPWRRARDATPRPSAGVEPARNCLRTRRGRHTRHAPSASAETSSAQYTARAAGGTRARLDLGSPGRRRLLLASTVTRGLTPRDRHHTVTASGVGRREEELQDPQRRPRLRRGGVAVPASRTPNLVVAVAHQDLGVLGRRWGPRAPRRATGARPFAVRKTPNGGRHASSSRTPRSSQPGGVIRVPPLRERVELPDEVGPEGA